MEEMELFHDKVYFMLSQLFLDFSFLSLVLKSINPFLKINFSCQRPSMQRWQCSIYNGTYETLIWSKICKIMSFLFLERPSEMYPQLQPSRDISIQVTKLLNTGQDKILKGQTSQGTKSSEGLTRNSSKESWLLYGEYLWKEPIP